MGISYAEICFKNDEGACCCNCKWHIRDYSHPDTNGKPISIQRGWICFAPEFDDCVFSEWSEHGLCEMHEIKDREI